MIDLISKKRNKSHININKMMLKTTNRDDFQDFKVLPSNMLK
jgi:hypothetical protein